MSEQIAFFVGLVIAVFLPRIAKRLTLVLRILPVVTLGITAASFFVPVFVPGAVFAVLVGGSLVVALLQFVGIETLRQTRGEK